MSLKTKLLEDKGKIEKIESHRFSNQINVSPNDNSISIFIKNVQNDEMKKILFTSTESEYVVFECQCENKVEQTLIIIVGNNSVADKTLRRGYYNIYYGNTVNSVATNVRLGPEILFNFKIVKGGTRNEKQLIINFLNYKTNINDCIIILDGPNVIIQKFILQSGVKRFLMQVKDCGFNKDYEIRLIHSDEIKGKSFPKADYNKFVYICRKIFSIKEHEFSESMFEDFEVSDESQSND